MSETYAPRGYARGGEERAGGVILVVVSCLSAVLVIAGLIYAKGTGPRHTAAVLAAGCEPSLFISGLPCTTQQMVIGQYEATVNPAVKQLTADTAAYRANENRHLVAAEAALTAEVSTEQALDNNLAAMTFTPGNTARALSLITDAASNGNNTPSAAIIFTPRMTVVADALIQANQALVKLTAEQARSTSLVQLRSFNPRTEAAGAAVQTEMKLLHNAVNAPLTAGS
jgi:hypothetical protein